MNYITDPPIPEQNKDDLDQMTDDWHRETRHVENAFDEALRRAQDLAYALGYRRGYDDACIASEAPR